MHKRFRHEFRTTTLDPDLASTTFGIQTNWHVIAGAQSCGKSTLIKLFADRGYNTVPEGARLFLEGEMAKGRSATELQENMVTLQQGIADTQLKIEGALHPSEVNFLDRAVPDCLAWWRVYGLNPNELLVKCFRYRYASVFVLDRLPVQGDGLRPEDQMLATFLDAWIQRDYTALGYTVVRVPVLPPQARMDFVLESLSGQGLL